MLTRTFFDAESSHNLRLILIIVVCQGFGCRRKQKNAPELGALLQHFFENDQALSALTLFDRRDIFRDAVFLCTIPLDTPRINSG